MDIGQPFEATQGVVGSSGGVDVPPPLAHVFGDRQTDASAGAGNQYGWHVSLLSCRTSGHGGAATNHTDRCTKKLARDNSNVNWSVYPQRSCAGSNVPISLVYRGYHVYGVPTPSTGRDGRL